MSGRARLQFRELALLLVCYRPLAACETAYRTSPTYAWVVSRWARTGEGTGKGIGMYVDERISGLGRDAAAAASARERAARRRRPAPVVVAVRLGHEVVEDRALGLAALELAVALRTVHQ